jgi:LPXTG-motif cell wall-anchored protein
MKKIITRGLYFGLFVGGLTFLGATAANAADQSTSGDDGLLSGTQIGAVVDLPADLTGNAISLIGDATTSDSSVAAPETAAEPAPEAPPADATDPPATTTSGDDAIGSGSQAIVDLVVPVEVSGNAISVLGDSSSDDAAVEPAAPAEEAPAPDVPSTTSGDDSLLGGTQGIASVAIPITASGNAVSVLGDAASSDSSVTGGAASGDSAAATPATTSGEDGIAGGNQVLPDLFAPITGTGNAVSVIGDASSSGSSVTGAGGNGGSSGGATTGGEGGILGGNQLAPVVGLPIVASGNAVCVVGDCTTGGGAVTPTDPTGPADPTDPTTPTNPTGPTTPTVPTAPTTPTQLTSPTAPTAPPIATTAGVSSSSFQTAGSSTGSGGSGLAETGVSVPPTLGAMGFLLLVGLALLIASRKKDAHLTL